MRTVPLCAALALVACAKSNPPAPNASPSASTSSAAVDKAYTGVGRADFNRIAFDLNLPVFWSEDKNGDGTIDPNEVDALLFYPTEGKWVVDGKFTQAFNQAFELIRRGPPAPEPNLSPDEQKRRKLVINDLEQGLPTLVETELRDALAVDKTFVQHVLRAANWVDALYATQTGARALAARLPQDDPASQSLFRRDWGPRCAAPKTRNDPACTAVPGAPKPVVDAYPEDLQQHDGYCADLEKLSNAQALLDHFVVVRRRESGGPLIPLSYSAAYPVQMTEISRELAAAATDMTDPNEAALKAYLQAASVAFASNDWAAADEVWVKMNARNSRWYLRVAPDEVYWDPCNHKAGFHLTFGRIDPGSLAWQDKLAPVEDEMERSLAALIGPPYAARKVAFHLPDFLNVVANAGDDRSAMGATLGQSLPNWGKVVAEGRGRTVAMKNFYTDPDSRAIRRKQATSLLDGESMKSYSDSNEPDTLSTILHEATHNLGPAHEYKVGGQTDAQAFGGSLASMLEELKAESGSVYFLSFLEQKGLVSPELARQTYAYDVVWAFGHISRGMQDPRDRAYSQLAAILLGLLLEEEAVTFDPQAKAANGVDVGAFTIHYEKFPAAMQKIMKRVGHIKATADKADAAALVAKFVDGSGVPQPLITERELRFPKQSFVYAVDF